MFRYRRCICVNCLQEVQEEGVGFLQAKQKQSINGDSTEEDQQKSSGNLRKCSQDCEDRVEMSSSGRLHFLQNVKNDNKD